MGFIPPLNLGGFQPSPATLAQWVYQIWQYLQENPIATQEQLQEYIGTFITSSPETQAMIGAGVDEYLTENPPTAPVQSVQGKTGAVQLAYNEIVPASNAVPVYKASSTPSTNTLVGQYNLGYRLFVNTTTQEIFTISPAGALSLVGRGKFDGTTVDVNSADGDTTIAEALSEKVNYTNSFTLVGFMPIIMNCTSRSVYVYINLPTFDKTKTVRVTQAPTNGMFQIFKDASQISNIIIDDTWIKTWVGDRLEISKPLEDMPSLTAWTTGLYFITEGQLVVESV